MGNLDLQAALSQPSKENKKEGKRNFIVYEAGRLSLPALIMASINRNRLHGQHTSLIPCDKGGTRTHVCSRIRARQIPNRYSTKYLCSFPQNKQKNQNQTKQNKNGSLKRNYHYKVPKEMSNTCVFQRSNKANK